MCGPQVGGGVPLVGRDLEREPALVVAVGLQLVAEAHAGVGEPAPRREPDRALDEDREVRIPFEHDAERALERCVLGDFDGSS
jgi:hypothetical protein